MTSSTPALLLETFEALDAAGVRYCLLRGHEALGVLDPRDVDLLVSPDDSLRLEIALARLGFAPRRAWGHAPHRFFEARDAAGSIVLDVVTSLRYGRPIRHLQVDLVSRCLGGRRRREPTWVPDPLDEFVTLLLHTLLDKADFAPAHRLRLTALWGEITAQGDRDDVCAHVARCTRGGIPADVLGRALDHQDWDVLRARRLLVARRMFWSAPASALWRHLRGRTARRAAYVLNMLHVPNGSSHG